MKKTILILLLITAAFCTAAFAQTVEIPIGDLKELRKLAADREYQKDRADEAEKQSAGWKQSAENWKNLYQDATKRADETQQGRIDQLKIALADMTLARNELQLANIKYKDQIAADREKIGELEFSNRKLKSERKYLFFGGVVIGAVGGGYLGYRAGSSSPVAAILPRQPQQSGFTFSVPIWQAK